MGETKARKVKVTNDAENLKIYIDDLLHTSIVKSEFAGFCSYKQNNVYYIEIWKPKGKRELLVHETRELWVDILKKLDEAL